MTPEDIHPHPKIAASLEKKRGGRKTRKSLILTDTPAKLAIEEDQTARRQKSLGQKLQK
ncbi:hypothetical protein HHI36_016669, partial [Cryptolaemus montrouzieri]